MKRNSIFQVRNPLEIIAARATDHAMHFIAFAQQELGQVSAVLARNSGNQSSGHGKPLGVSNPGLATRQKQSGMARLARFSILNFTRRRGPLSSLKWKIRAPFPVLSAGGRRHSAWPTVAPGAWRLVLAWRFGCF